MGQYEENCELLSEHSESFSSLDGDDNRFKPKSSIRHILTISIIILSLGLNTVLLVKDTFRQCSPQEIMAKSNFFSPAIGHIDPVLETRKFDGSFQASSEFSQDPGPVVDAAWSRIADGPGGRITEEELKNSHLSTKHVSIPDDEGGYAAKWEFEHQLHCLDMLRMSIFSNYDYYHAKSPDMVNNGTLFRSHVRHCVEMLRQVLVCNADTGIVPFIWLKDVTNPAPYFFTWHTCKNFDSILEFTKKRQLPGMAIWKPKEGEIMEDMDTYFGWGKEA